jgi:hypothetical protein
MSDTAVAPQSPTAQPTEQTVFVHSSGTIPSTVRTIAGLPMDKLVTMSLIAALAGVLYSMVILTPAAEERRRIDMDRQQRELHDTSLRAIQDETERGRTLIKQEGQLNRLSSEVSSKVLSAAIQSLATNLGKLESTSAALAAEIMRLEKVIDSLIRKQESDNPVTVPIRP